MNCEYCNRVYLHKRSLDRHNRECHSETLIEIEMKCECCQKVFGYKQNFDRHLKDNKGCETLQQVKEQMNDIEDMNTKLLEEVKEKTEVIISHELYILQLQEDNDLLRKALKNAETPRTVINNNIILNIIDLKQIEKKLLKSIKKKSYVDLLDGLEPYLDAFASSLNTSDSKMYICTDHSRQIFAYKDDKGNIKKDYNGETLFQLEEKVKPLAIQKLTDRFNYWLKTPEENILRRELRELEEKIVSMYNHRKGHLFNSKEYNRIEENISNMEKQVYAINCQLNAIKQKNISQEQRETEIDKLMKAKTDIHYVGKDIDINKKCIRYLSKHPMMNT